MAGILGTGSQASQNPVITGIDIQTSVAGGVIPILFGNVRVAANLFWYGDFETIPGSNGSGKGGILASKGGGNTTYQAAVMLGLCEGPITGIGDVYADKALTTLSALGLTFFSGSYVQTAWGYMTAAHPSQALGYRGLAYLAASVYALGSSASLPNQNFEVFGLRYNAIGTGDADPSLVISDLLTNAVWGAGWTAGLSLTTFQQYAMALGLVISPAYTSQRAASDMLQEIATVGNSEWIWASDTLTLIPYGDQAVSGNGFTYTPPSAPLFDLGDDDYCPQSGDEPLIRQRLRPSDQINVIKREYLDSGNYYNPATIEVRDQANIDLYGIRQDASTAVHLFTQAAPAQMSASLELGRQQIRNLYTFRLDSRYACLDPMDIVTVSDSGLGLVRQWVRIQKVQEDFVEGEGAYYTITAEEYLDGTGSAATFAFGSNVGYVANYNSTPDNAAIPVIFEPPFGLVNDPEVWIGVAAGGPNWSGADVWLSTDGVSYRFAGTVTPGAAAGVLTAALAAVTPAPVGQTIDNTHTLSINIGASDQIIPTASIADAVALNTLSYVDGELLAFANANLTSAAHYDLTYLVRGAYNTVPGLHAIGSQFLKLDQGVLKIPVTPDRIGQLLYVKLLSANIFGGAKQTLADVSAYAYTVQGEAIAGPLPDVLNFRTTFVDGKLWFYWDEVTDPRTVLYELRKGTTWAGAQFLGRVAHPPVPVFGDDTYWVAAYSQPAPGIIVYSTNPASLAVSGAALIANVIATHDEAATGWSGTLTAGIEISGPDIRTKVASVSGTYTIPTGHRISIGRPAPCPLAITWALIGQYDNADFLGQTDFLGNPDFLGFSATALVDGFPEYRLSQDNQATWGPWTKYAPGVYLASDFDARINLSRDPTAAVQAYITAFTIAVDAPDRDDFYQGLTTSSSVDTTVTFKPNGAAATAAFNGGPGGVNTPALTFTLRPATAGDDVVIVSLSLTAVVFKVLNAGARVVRTIDLLAQGY